jgi:hypothetical protein
MGTLDDLEAGLGPYLLKGVYRVSTLFRRKPESLDIRMLEIPDQARNDRQKTFYDAIIQPGNGSSRTKRHPSHL